MRARLGTAPTLRTQPLESRLGRSVDQNRISSQTVSRRSDTPATATPASTAGQSTRAVPTEGAEPNSVLLWNRPDPSGWGQYRTDMSAKLNMHTMTFREDARRMIGGECPTVSRLYRIPGVAWLLAGQEQFSSATTLRYVDLNGLPQDNTFGPLNTRSLPSHLLGRVSFWPRISPTTSISRCTDSLLNHPARHLVNIGETIPERPRWKDTTRDMQG